MLKNLRGAVLLVPVLTLLVGCGTSTGGASGQRSGRVSGNSSAATSGGGVSTSASAAPTDPASFGSLDGGRGSGPGYVVSSVVDGDTIKVLMDGRKTSIRLIGVDTPETKKPHVTVQCFGKEASSHMQSLVQSRTVQLVADPTQGDKDKYGRLLRYVYVGSTNVALSQIEGGFGREDTYDKPYHFQTAFRQAQTAAQEHHLGTWGGACQGFHTHDGAASAGPTARETAASPAPSSSGCDIKGNITSSGAKVAHLPGSRSYARTKIDRPGERMFCSVQEATAAGWRIAAD